MPSKYVSLLLLLVIIALLLVQIVLSLVQLIIVLMVLVLVIHVLVTIVLVHIVQVVLSVPLVRTVPLYPGTSGTCVPWYTVYPVHRCTLHLGAGATSCYAAVHPAPCSYAAAVRAPGRRGRM